MNYGYIRVGTATPVISVGSAGYNLPKLNDLADLARQKKVKVLLFPELSLTGASCGDLFRQPVLQSAVLPCIQAYAEHTKEMDLISFLGAPLVYKNKLYDVMVAVGGGKILGIIPNTKPTDRCFSSAVPAFTEWTIDGETYPVGSNLTFLCTGMEHLSLAVRFPGEIDRKSNANVLLVPASLPETVGKREYMKNIVKAKSAMQHNAILFCNAGEGESTTDAVYAGQNLIFENGTMLYEKEPFSDDDTLIFSEVDVDLLTTEKINNKTDFPVDETAVPFSLKQETTPLSRNFRENPFVPTNEEERIKRCKTVLKIQTRGLRQRLQKARAKTAVIGISGGLDSTLALLVAVSALDEMAYPRKNVVAVTMPGFGTTTRTKSNASVLCEELGVTLLEIPIVDSVLQHFRDIGHDERIHDVTYENAQARERTQILMDVANERNGLVVGTGDLSELALGWATYNGDHMSMYGVNADVPKTLIRHIVDVYADECIGDGKITLGETLKDILATPISPELLPADDKGDIAQKTEDLVGPYEIHDFYLFYFLRYGFPPRKLFCLAKIALGNKYDDKTLLHWLENFVRRFFAQQFKRSCLPDGPAIGSVSLSPRGAWAMPSDASCLLWLMEIDAMKKELNLQ